MIIRVENNLAINAPKTYLSVGKSSGVGTVNVKNVNSFSANWAVQIGNTGEERSEIKIINSASGTSIVLTANTSFEHPADTPLYAIKFDQVVFEKSTSGTSGVATPITNGTVSITPDHEYTQFDDTTASTADAFRTYFRNSVSEETSSESDWITSSGFSFYSLAKIRDRAMNKLFSKGYIKDDEQVNDWINEWLEEMNNAIVNVDKSYSMGTANVAFGTSGLGTVSATDFKSLKRVWVTYDGVNKYKATKLDVSEMHPQETYNSTHPYYIWQGDDTLEVVPHESGGTAETSYYKRAPVLVNDTDELPFAMRSHTNSFVNYVVAEAYFNDDKDEKGDRYLSRAVASKNLFVGEMTPRNFTNTELIELTDVIYGEEDDLLYG
jgi:hypothetical protein